MNDQAKKLWAWWRKYKCDPFYAGLWFGFIIWAAVDTIIEVHKAWIFLVVLIVFPIVCKLQWHLERDDFTKKPKSKKTPPIVFDFINEEVTPPGPIKLQTQSIPKSSKTNENKI